MSKNIYTATYTNIILIPYRNRKEHLDIFIKDAIPLFEKHLQPFKVIIIEQEEGKLFNRGLLLNIGVNEYKDKTQFFFTHDVDIVPSEKCIQEYYTKINTIDTGIIGIYTSCCNTLGGIIKFDTKTIFNINGFPNDIWGWGAEDIAIQYRAKHFNIDIKKNILCNSDNRDAYFLRFDDINDRNGCNNRPNICIYSLDNLSNDDKLAKIYSSGLNNLTYKIIERKDINSYVEIIKVSI